MGHYGRFGERSQPVGGEKCPDSSKNAGTTDILLHQHPHLHHRLDHVILKPCQKIVIPIAIPQLRTARAKLEPSHF